MQYDINSNNSKINKNYNISTKKTTEATNNNYQQSSGQKSSNKNEESKYGINSGTKISLRKKLKKLKIINIGKYADNLCSSLNVESDMVNMVSNEENKISNKIKGGDKNELIEESNINLNTALYEKFNIKEEDNKIYELINNNKNSKNEYKKMNLFQTL